MCFGSMGQSVSDVCISHQSDWIYYKQPIKFLDTVSNGHINSSIKEEESRGYLSLSCVLLAHINFIIWSIVQLPAVVVEITIERISRILFFLRTRGLGPG